MKKTLTGSALRWMRVLAPIALLALLTVRAGNADEAAYGKFPPGFLWGAATAAHQVEGGNTQSDWWEWEEQCHVVDCERSGAADDQYNRYPQDLAMAQKLGMGAYRMSVEWARLEPVQGVFSAQEFAHYRKVLREVHARGMKVVLTLHHFTLPLWVAHHSPAGENSWLDPAVPQMFADFAEQVVRELGDQVDYWITINEPTVNVLTGYVAGLSPPGLKDIQKAPRALAGFVKAHALAYHVIHHYYPQAKVSIAHHVRIFDPYHPWNPLDRAVAGYVHEFWNHQFLKSIREGKIRFHIPFVLEYSEDFPLARGTLDFLGINYYTRDLLQFDLGSPQKFTIQLKTDAPKNDLGWEIYPEGLYRVIDDMKQYHLPIFVTENGTADAQDTHRAQFICDHLREVKHAINEGVDVFGYLHWSLIDNFEWSNGYAPRFGLAAVDYTTQNRTLRGSAYRYAEIMKANSLESCAF